MYLLSDDEHQTRSLSVAWFRARHTNTGTHTFHVPLGHRERPCTARDATGPVRSSGSALPRLGCGLWFCSVPCVLSDWAITKEGTNEAAGTATLNGDQLMVVEEGKFNITLTYTKADRKSVV